MAAEELSAVRCPGSLLAALLMDAGKASPGGRSEGLLLGCGKRRREEVRGDDVQEAGERVVLEADLTAFLRTTAPAASACPEGSFYRPDGQVQGKRLARHLAAAGVQQGGQEHGVVGWYVTRPMATSSSAEAPPPPPRPTLRELAVLQSLGRHLREQGQQGQQGHVWTPPVLLVVALGLRPREATQAWGYGLYYLREDQDGEVGMVMGDSSAPQSLVPRSLLLEVRSVAHDAAAEYRAYRGGYAPALLPLQEGEGGEGQGGAGAVGAPMPPALAALAARVPSPYVEEAELHFDALLGRLHGLVDAIRAEETKVLALQREHSRLQRRLLQQGKEQGKGGETAELGELLAAVGPSSSASEAAARAGAGVGGGAEAPVAAAVGAAAE